MNRSVYGYGLQLKPQSFSLRKNRPQNVPLVLFEFLSRKKKIFPDENKSINRDVKKNNRIFRKIGCRLCPSLKNHHIKLG